ncbi:MAG: LacI family DNA-binding transcriptional regulator [Acetobacteraceae bacterium]|nr:LacI family DNA-binding transcriptional regulator [Acetobacteraceae bacterium]
MATDGPVGAEVGAAGAERHPVTARQLARVLGISQSTVSRAFSPGGTVAPAMRARVLEAAARLGYQPNAIARSLSTRRSGIVGIVMATMTNPFYPEVLEHLSRRLHEADLRTLLFNVPPGQELDSELPLLLRYQVDAVVIASATISSAMAREWAATGRAAVLFNRTVPGAKVASVSCDNEAGGRAVADFLVARGHRCPAFVAGRRDTSTNLDRERGFLARLQDLGVPLHARVDGGEYSYEAGFAAALELAGQRPDAIFFANDIMALGGMDALRHRLRLCVPEDVSVVGFDDIPMAAWPSYGLTTVQQPVQRMIEETVRILVEAGRGGEATQVHLLPGCLIERGSTRGRAAA